jgi:hypothetical protein
MWEKGYRMVFNPEARVYHTHSESLSNYMKKKFRIGFWKALVLKRHPRKVFRDSHTPQTLKLEMALAMLFLFCFALLPFSGWELSLVLFPLGAFLAVIAPFVVTLLRRDAGVAVFAPFLLLARALALSFGLMVGALKFYVLNGNQGSQAATEDRAMEYWSTRVLE